MAEVSLPEYWLRGAVAGVPDLLQPVAHALLQAREELGQLLVSFPDTLLWERPAGVASVGFHLQHLCGVLDRLFTYAGGHLLSEAQLAYLSLEGKAVPGITTAGLLHAFDEQLERALLQLRGTAPDTLTEVRTVGRKALPSTVLGLLFHAAEHTMRHTGQLLVTVKVLQVNAGGE